MANLNAHFNTLTYVPELLLSCAPEKLNQILGEPTLIDLAGRREETLFISILLHGNETTGFYAIQKLLNKYKEQTLPRNLCIFMGNLEAAEHAVRRLAGQPDFNRIWPGTEHKACSETRMAQAIVDMVSQKKLFASIDIHNNTGLNPHYACINKLTPQYMQLANLFGRLVVYFTRPKGVLSAAMAEYGPAVTLECGRPEKALGVEHAFEFIDSCLHLDHLPDEPVHPQDIDIFHTVAQVKIAQETDFSFSDKDASLQLYSDLETMNFIEVQSGTPIAKVNNSRAIPLNVVDEEGRDVATKFFEVTQNELRFTRTTMPSMMTLDENVIRQDCLCYLMERL